MKYITTLSQYSILPDNTYTIFHYKEQSVDAVQNQTDLNSKNFEGLRNVMCTQNAEFPNFQVGGPYS